MKNQTRNVVKCRDNNKCCICDHKKDLQLHHIVPQRFKGPNEYWNLILICNKCHSNWHKLESELEIMWDMTNCVYRFYCFLGVDDPEDQSNIHLDLLESYTDILLTKLIKSIKRDPKRNKIPKNIKQLRNRY